MPRALVEGGLEPALLSDVESDVLLNPLKFEGKDGARILVGIPQLLCDYALQPQSALRDGDLSAERAAQKGEARSEVSDHRVAL